MTFAIMEEGDRECHQDFFQFSLGPSYRMGNARQMQLFNDERGWLRHGLSKFNVNVW